MALLTEKNLIFSAKLNRLFTSNGLKVSREKEANQVFRD